MKEEERDRVREKENKKRERERQRGSKRELQRNADAGCLSHQPDTQGEMGRRRRRMGMTWMAMQR